jgi:hypothetical protein
MNTTREIRRIWVSALPNLSATQTEADKIIRMLAADLDELDDKITPLAKSVRELADLVIGLKQ